jgi:hypothetical protein
VDERLSVGLAQVLAGSARWRTQAAAFADVVPRTVTGTCPSAVAVGAIHAQVAASHAAFGARLADTAAGAHGAVASYYIMDAEQNAQALSDGINGAV